METTGEMNMIAKLINAFIMFTFYIWSNWTNTPLWQKIFELQVLFPIMIISLGFFVIYYLPWNLIKPKRFLGVV